MRKIMLFGATVAVVLATFGAYSVASADGGGSAQVIRLRGVTVQEAEIDNGEEGFGLGDGFVESDDLYDRTGALVGRLGVSCDVTRFVDAEEDSLVDLECNAGLKLAAGTIEVQGLVTFSDDSGPSFSVAVVGGTGAYRNAHGELQVRDLSETETEYTIRLT